MSTARSPRILSTNVSAALLAGVAVLALTGCTSDKLEAKAEQLRANPTPELVTLSQREADSKNTQTVTNNENLRAMSQDWGRFWLMDRPSRLNPEPMGH